jgi:Ca2+-binding RTX toxin-like protein
MGIYNYQSDGDTPPGHKTTVTKDHLSDNRYEGLELDAGKIVASTNTIGGGDAGIDILLYAGQSPQVNATLNGNTITGSNGNGTSVRVSTDGAATVAPKVNASDNALLTPNGVVNPSPFVINVKSSWWGDASGPSDWALGTGASTSANVNFFPWATDSSFSGFASCTASGHNIVGPFSAGDVLCGTSGNDFVDASGGPVLILGNGGNDQLKGTTSADAIIAGTGNDFIDGRGGGDSIQCRGGSDSVVPYVGDRKSGC